MRLRERSQRKSIADCEIRDDTVIMKNGSIRSVLASINFALKSDDEQMPYFGLCEFLKFHGSPMQICNRANWIWSYLNFLKEAEAKQTNDLLKMQMAEYQQ
jgi:hypothetical protein